MRDALYLLDVEMTSTYINLGSVDSLSCPLLRLHGPLLILHPKRLWSSQTVIHLKLHTRILAFTLNCIGSAQIHGANVHSARAMFRRLGAFAWPPESEHMVMLERRSKTQSRCLRAQCIRLARLLNNPRQFSLLHAKLGGSRVTRRGRSYTASLQ